jgi:hypothetical protein
VYTFFIWGFFLVTSTWAAVTAVFILEDSVVISALVAYVVGFIALIFGGGFLACWCNLYRSRSDPRLVCPRCGRSLLMVSETVIATGDCPRCHAPRLTVRGHSKTNPKNKPWPDPEL